MDDNMETPLVNNVLKMAIHNRTPPLKLIWHTDRERLHE